MRLPWLAPTPMINLLFPGIETYCRRYGVTVHWYDFANLIFEFEGVWYISNHSKFEVFADSEQFGLLDAYLRFICINLKNSYMGMDN